MNSALRFFVALFLSVSAAVVAQEPVGDKPKKTETAIAGRDGVSMPKCKHCPDPKYTPEARMAQFRGVVVLSFVVTSDGKARDIQVVKNPGLGLDEKSIETVRQWRFKPAMKDGVPVDAQVRIEISFSPF